MKRTLIRFGPQEILTGIQPATVHDANALWKDGSNVIFREGALRPEPGQGVLFSKKEADTIIGFGESERSGRPILFFGTPSKLWRLDLQAPSGTELDDVSRLLGGPYSGIKNQTGDVVSTRWSFQSWGEWMIAANGRNELQYYKPGNTDFTNIGSPPAGVTYKAPTAHVAAGVPFRPAFLVRARGSMLAFSHHIHSGPNTDNEIPEGEQSVWWCDQNNIFDWLPVRGNAAGTLILRDAPSPIMSAHPMLDGAAAYTLTTQHLIQFIGDPLWFGNVRTQYGIGALGHHAVVPVGRLHFGAGPQGLWRSDGTQFQYIDHPIIRDWMYSRLTSSQGSKVVAWHDPSQERVVWFFPADGSLAINAAIGFDYAQNIVHIPGYVRSAASTMEAFDYSITGSPFGDVYRQSFLGTGGVAVDSDPVLARASATIAVGYGRGGYGGLGYGGQWFSPAGGA